MDHMGSQMDVSAAIAQEVLAQIQRRNKLSSGFQEIVGDYQRVLQRSKEQAVRQSPALIPFSTRCKCHTLV